MKLRFLGHSAFEVKTGSGHTVLIDPYLDDNPVAAAKSGQVEADFIIPTHAHGDHLGDTFKIAQRCGSLIICVAELAGYCTRKGFKAHAMQIGGARDFPFGRLKFTPAWHGSKTPDGEYAGLAAGILLWVDGTCIYHAGDTGLFYDMKLIGEMNKVDYMLVPIGDNYTMGIDDAVKAVEFVRPRVAIPIHYNTWPVIEADPQVFADKVEALGASCLVLKPGDSV
ncbi:MAG: metal-dependent hydrolase [Candidatus Syntrophosphaera sp.]|nr:metal-dependent hydrolase [Candidatus Syntrophosphaera sp.]